ncbi:armadillo-type protein [Mycena maculata]|uniref:Armadillo-type protein n=1 Tax=Mycena maculata TaxID=230809 RepID=A0AAD7JMH0_9AGAR|nr:armadillo-type protein [Mycena maculata]
MQLVSFLRNDVAEVIQGATYALSQLSRWLNGAQAAVDAKVLDCIEELLSSSNDEIQTAACWLVGHLASHESIAMAVLTKTPCIRLMTLLRHGNTDITCGATYALCQISFRLEGALAVVDAKVMDHVAGLLESPHALIRGGASRLVRNLASYESTAAAIAEFKLCAVLVSLLQ